VQEYLKIENGETTSDGKYDFKEVACLGCCVQAAVVEVNGKIYAKLCDVCGICVEYCLIDNTILAVQPVSVLREI